MTTLESIERIERKVIRRGRRAPVGIAFSTKDRTKLSRQTASFALGEADCDGYWMDGSATDGGRRLPLELRHELPSLREVHLGVTGGPDPAIVYSLSYLLRRGYDYIGLVENDVLLSPGWLRSLMQLFRTGASEGLRVGAVSARTFDRRVLFQLPAFAVMFCLGAGMVLFRREAVQCVLDHYRTGTFGELAQLIEWLTDADITKEWEIRKPDGTSRSAFDKHWTSADWLFDHSLMLNGYASLATVPSLAHNIDADQRSVYGIKEVADGDPPSGLPIAKFTRFKEKLKEAGDSQMARESILPYVGDRYVVFPHHVARHRDSFISDGWRLKWDQTFGPFTFVSARPGAAISMPLSGPVDLLFQRGPWGGECHLVRGPQATRVNLKHDADDFISVSLPGTSGQISLVHLEALSEGVTWRGFESPELQLNFSDQRAVRPLLAALPYHGAKTWRAVPWHLWPSSLFRPRG
jgi:hypothetical protein